MIEQNDMLILNSNAHERWAVAVINGRSNAKSFISILKESKYVHK